MSKSRSPVFGFSVVIAQRGSREIGRRRRRSPTISPLPSHESSSCGAQPEISSDGLNRAASNVLTPPVMPLRWAMVSREISEIGYSSKHAPGASDFISVRFSPQYSDSAAAHSPPTARPRVTRPQRTVAVSSPSSARPLTVSPSGNAIVSASVSESYPADTRASAPIRR